MLKSVQLFDDRELVFKKKRLIILIEFLILALIKLNIKDYPFFWVSRERWVGVGGDRWRYILGGWGWSFLWVGGGEWGLVDILWVSRGEWRLVEVYFGWEGVNEHFLWVSGCGGSYILGRWTFLLVGTGGWRWLEAYFCRVDGGKFRMVRHFLKLGVGGDIFWMGGDGWTFLWVGGGGWVRLEV